MSSKMTITLALAAGLLGGALSHVLSPQIAQAQAQGQAQAPVQKMVRAQSFVLMTEDGKPAGMLAIDKDGKPNLKLFDGDQMIWSARGAVIHPATE
jgi:hypothetical protein